MLTFPFQGGYVWGSWLSIVNRNAPDSKLFLDSCPSIRPPLPPYTPSSIPKELHSAIPSRSQLCFCGPAALGCAVGAMLTATPPPSLGIPGHPTSSQFFVGLSRAGPPKNTKRNGRPLRDFANYQTPSTC